MTAYLMITIGMLACASGLVLSLATTAGPRPIAGDPGRATRAVRALLLIYGLDLFLQLWRIDGGREPLGVAIVAAATTGGIFWLLARYIAALTGPAIVDRTVSVLALSVTTLGIVRACVRAAPPYEGQPTHYYALSVAWLAVGLALALAVAASARRRLRAAGAPREGRRKGGGGWAGLVAGWSYAIAAIVSARTLAAPFLTRSPSLAFAFDSPLVDTLLVVVFVVLGAATGGLGRVAAPGPGPDLDAETVERRDRLLKRADAVLERDFADPTLTMPRLAAAVGCSEHQLSAALNQGRGVNFFAYVNARRVEQARVLMRAGGMTVTDIAYACGYNSRSTFYAAFKAVTGQSPGAWRAGDEKAAAGLS